LCAKSPLFRKAAIKGRIESPESRRGYATFFEATGDECAIEASQRKKHERGSLVLLIDPYDTHCVDSQVIIFYTTGTKETTHQLEYQFNT
jgi:hypothetical protein